MPNRNEYNVISLSEETLEPPRQASANGGNRRLVGVQSVPRSVESETGNPVSLPEHEFIVSAPIQAPIAAEPELSRIVAAPPRAQGVIGTSNSIRSTPRMIAQNSMARDETFDEFRYQGEVPLSRLSPSELRRAFQRTFTSENRHLSTYRADSGFDDVSFTRSARVETGRMGSEDGGVRPLEIKISFDGDGSSLTRDTYNLLAEYAGLVAANPQRAVQISISERGTRSFDGRKLAARRLAIIEQVLKDSGVIDKRIIPVLSQRNDDAFVLRVISAEMFHTLTERRRDIFGEETAGKTQRSLAW